MNESVYEFEGNSPDKLRQQDIHHQKHDSSNNHSFITDTTIKHF